MMRMLWMFDLTVVWPVRQLLDGEIFANSILLTKLFTHLSYAHSGFSKLLGQTSAKPIIVTGVDGCGLGRLGVMMLQ